jgi:hypothetical protein
MMQVIAGATDQPENHLQSMTTTSVIGHTASFAVVMFAALRRTRTAPSATAQEDAQKFDPANTQPKGSLAGVPLQILLSERSGPGALLSDLLTHQPSPNHD